VGYQARQPHQEDVPASITDAYEELLECVCFSADRARESNAGR
jgi:hypothetical protein